MKIPYYKNGEFVKNLTIPSNFWNSLRSRYSAVRNRNLEKLSRIMSEIHPEKIGLGVNYAKVYIYTYDRENQYKPINTIG